MSEPLLRLEGLSKYYTSGRNVVAGLSEVSLSFSRGEFVAVTGESGSGKSTLAAVLGGILPYESGEMYLLGRPTSHYDGSDRERYRRDRVSYISQSYGILPGCSVLENVISALRLSGVDRAHARLRAAEILRQVELWELKSRRAGALSSGQKQRLAIARALAKPADILVADEPTGNLDPENSERVIRLLHRASRERLVILITHEFSEAEELATRHIALQDGRVVLDAPLRPAFSPEAAAVEKPRREKGLGAYVARLQISGRPVWSALVLAIFALGAFGIFAFLGSFIVALDDTPVRVYDDSAFQNGDMERIVVMRSDYESLTQDDYEIILSLEYVESLEPWGLLSDINYAWREGVDFDYSYSVQGKGDDHERTKFISTTVKLRSGAPFLQSLPLLPDGESMISSGRLPENIYEVVACGGEEMLGSVIDVYINDAKNWSSSVKIPLQVTVVGLTDHGSGLYFHEDLGRAFNDYYMNEDSSSLILYSMDLPDDAVRLSQELFTRAKRYENYVFSLYDFTRPIVSEDGSQSWETYDVKMICPENGNEELGEATHGSYLGGYLILSRNNFNKSVPDTGCAQASLSISDYAYTDRVLDSLRQAGFVALSPFREGSTKLNPNLAAEREQTLSVCLVALVCAVALQILVLRALFASQSQTLGLLANIGLVCRDAKRSLWWQTLAFTLAGQLLAMAALALCRELGVERIVSLWRYLPGEYFLLLSGVHLAAGCLSALWLCSSLAGRLFPDSGAKLDLDMDGEAAV